MQLDGIGKPGKRIEIKDNPVALVYAAFEEWLGGADDWTISHILYDGAETILREKNIALTIDQVFHLCCICSLYEAPVVITKCYQVSFQQFYHILMFSFN